MFRQDADLLKEFTAAASHHLARNKLIHRATARTCADLTESAFDPTIRCLFPERTRELMARTTTSTLQRASHSHQGGRQLSLNERLEGATPDSGGHVSGRTDHEGGTLPPMYAIWTATWKTTSARSRTSFQHVRNSRWRPFQTTFGTERGGRK